jgi:protein O-GlcNAc transferase
MLLDDAIRLHQAGQLAEAEVAYRKILEASPRDAAALHMLGVVHLQKGEAREAAELIARAIAVDPEQAVFFNNFGAALHALGRTAEALAAFHRAAAIRPQYADAVSNVAMAYDSLGRFDLAERWFRQALEIAPDHRDARSKYAALLEKQGNFVEGIRLQQQLVEREPGVESHVRLGNLLLGAGKSLEATAQYEKALKLGEVEPSSNGQGPSAHFGAALFNLGNCYHEQHRVPEARRMFRRAAEACPRTPLWRLRGITACPAVFASRQEIDDYCYELSAELDRWRESPPPAKWRDLLTTSAFPNFTFSYLGRNVRPLKEKFAALYEHYFRDLPPPEESGLAAQGKRRIGLIITQRHEGIFLRCMTGIMRGLNRERLELVMLCPAASVKPLQQGLAMEGLKFVTIPTGLEEAAKAIREVRCDVLYYWEAGSDALNYFLPFCRLAPVQATSHGSQITSGNPAIGHFYSSGLMEVETAASHYSERLWNSSTLLMTQSRLPRPAKASPGKFGLPEDRTLYMCLQNPLKLHPDFDALLAGVLRGDRRGVVVLLKGAYEYAERELRKRFQRTLPDVLERIVMLPYQKFPEYCELMQMADVVLDPLYFGHGSSAYDVFSFDQPLVTLPTELNVGRVGSAFYAKMGLADLVANSAEQYVKLAVRLGTDREYRRQVQSRITMSSPALFDDPQPIVDHERFFSDVAANSTSNGFT